MGKGVKEKIVKARMRKNQQQGLTGDYYMVTYKEIKNGVTYIRSRWIKRKPRK